MNAAALRMFSGGPDVEPEAGEWEGAGRYCFAAVQLVAETPQSEPLEPIQERAEALAILLLQGSRYGRTPNALIRAGIVLDVVRAAWRKAMAGQS